MIKTVLIVEDEKLIRQGIKTMVQRSGVSVEIIMECNNGEVALEILKEQKIDVMFTDIRMPKMDGITLVQEMQQLDNKPLTVAISGYDDFSYAVEMMRYGVREYILKPVERQKIVDIMKKFEAELEDSKKQDRASEKLGRQQLKYSILNNQITEEEMRFLEDQYGEWFGNEDYYVCCKNAGTEDSDRKAYIFLKSLGDNDVFIVKAESLDMLLKNELLHEYVGVSAEHHTIGELRKAYREALKLRRRAFCTNSETVMAADAERHIPDQLILDARKLIETDCCQQRLQLLGTDRTEEVLQTWNTFFNSVKNARLSAEEFEGSILAFFSNASANYRNVIDEADEKLNQLKNIWKYPCINDYEEDFMDWILELHNTINSKFDTNRNVQKIKQAVDYVQENYSKNLNMAVVSNYISMNYSLFSYSFKQYTGSNFVTYLKKLRMEEAKKLLADTDMRVIEISQKVGYDNEKHFMKMFKGTYGVSPSEYRKNAQLK